MKKESNSDYLNGLSAQYKQEIAGFIKEAEKDRENGISFDWVKINFQSRDFKIGVKTMKKTKFKKAIYTGETSLYFINGEEYIYKKNDIDDSNDSFYHEYLFLDETCKGEFSHYIDKEYFKDNFLKTKKEKVKKVREAVSVKSDPEFFTKGCIYKFENQTDGLYYIEDNISDGVIDHMFTKDQFKRNFVVIKKGKKQHD